jgi:lysophospholipase L1-like esterase
MGVLDPPALTRAALTQVIAPISTIPNIASNCESASQTGFTHKTTGGTGRQPHFANVAATNLTLTYSNHYVSGSPGAASTDTAGPVSYVISAAFEFDSVVYPVTFNDGATTVTIAAGDTATSDPVPGLAVSRGQLFYSRTYINSTDWYPNRTSYSAASSGGFASGVDRTGSGAAAVSDSASEMFAPCRIGGTAVAGASLVIIGDSIAQGSGETNGGQGLSSLGLSGSAGGFLQRAAYGRAGVTNLARGGDQLQWFLRQAGHYYKLPLVEGYTHALSEYGTNDIFTGARSLAQVQADLISLWQILAAMNMKVGHCTILPRTTSTDSWATLNNQSTITGETVRTGLNTWLRAGAPVSGSPIAADNAGTVTAGSAGHPLSAVFDTAAVVESSTNSGKFRVDQGTPTLDGVHPSTALHTLMAAVITPSFFD